MQQNEHEFLLGRTKNSVLSCVLASIPNDILVLRDAPAASAEIRKPKLFKD